MTALLVLPPLGQRIIATSDEARFALLARDIIERGAWFDVQVRGKPYRNKPPLYAWSIAALSRPAGRVTEATALAPVALAAIGTVLFTFLLGDRLFNRRAGLWAALILATSYGFFGHSQLVLPDMIVLCFATLAGYAFWRAVTDPPGRGWLVLFYAALALGVFAKGPVGLLPLLVAVIWLWTEHGLQSLVRLWSLTGAGLFALITLGWLGPFLALGARSFAGETLWDDWLAWYFGAPDNPVRFAYKMAVGFSPWTSVSLLGFAYALRAWRSPAVRFTLLWLAVPVLVLLLSAHQKMRYVLSIYPGAALLVAWWAEVHGTERTVAGRVIGWLSLGASVGTIVALHIPQWWGGEARLLLSRVSWELLPLLPAMALLGGALFWGLRTGRPALWVQGVVVMMVVILGYGIWPLNKHYNEVWNFKRLAATTDRYAGGGDVAVFKHRSDWWSLDFYLGRSPHSILTVEELREYVTRRDRPVVVIEDLAWRVIRPQFSRDVRLLEHVTIENAEISIVGNIDR